MIYKCYQCRYFSTNHFGNTVCVLYPKWREVDRDHYCGQSKANREVVDKERKAFMEKLFVSN